MRDTTTKDIKKVLSDVYGSRNVRVTRGRGTAYGWIHVHLYVDPVPFGREKMMKLSETVRRAIIKQFKNDLSTYYPDDGIGEASHCLIVDVTEREGGISTSLYA